MSFDSRWRELALLARAAHAPSTLPSDLSARARQLEPEPRPWIAPRWTLRLAVAAVLLSAIALALTWRFDLAHRPSSLLALSVLPPPPRLPSPPDLESPGHYIALARATWKELSP